MGGVILENLSGRKLFVLVLLFLLVQTVCFFIGGFIAPSPSNVESVLATKCFDYENKGKDAWFYVRGIGSCRRFTDWREGSVQNANDLVFAFQLPTPRDNIILTYSRWQQSLIGVLMFDVVYHPDMEMAEDVSLTMDVRMGYRNYGDPESSWKQYATATVRRHLHCNAEGKKAGYYYNCSLVPLFELGSLYHDFYLINIRLPVVLDGKSVNAGLGHIADVSLAVINQNGGFVKIWFALKCVFFPAIVAVMIWFWKRVHQLQRSPVLLEYMLIILGGALTLLNAPFEASTLFADAPFVPLFQDIRQGLFYAALLNFWLVFAGEHLMIQEPTPRHWSVYWKHLSAVAGGCCSLLIFDTCEKGAQIWDPFYSIWVSHAGTNVALTFIILAGISASIYFFFLCYMIWRVFCNISVKRATLPSMSSVRRLHYEGIIYRFKFLMLATLACAAMTVTGFILGQVSEGRWKWDEHLQLEYASAFFTGVYGMWNVYIFALMVLYAPSHKQWPSDADLCSSAADDIQMTNLSHCGTTEPNEISTLTTFARKAAIE